MIYFKFILIILIVIQCILGDILNVVSNKLQYSSQLKIIGGRLTDISQFPHQISLRYRNVHRCGGSIISPNIILTAAHCVKGLMLRALLTVRAGSSFQNGGIGYVEKTVRRIIIHEQYNSRSMNNDIALLILNGDFEFSKTIQSISLPELNDKYPEGTLAYVSGWGATAEGQSGSHQLQYVGVNVQSQARCSMQYATQNMQITNAMLCAGSINGGKDSCQGDSGGPLMMINKENQRTLIGVVSWGLGCGRRTNFGVYVNIASMRLWIDQKITSIQL